MKRLFSPKMTRWLLPSVLILFILQVVTLPMVLGITYSGRSEAPDHTLTYTQNKLTWDSATGIDDNGVAELDLFDAVYDNVRSLSGKNVVAPGTQGYNIIRLVNSIDGSVDYKAVLYRIRSNDTLPVATELAGDGFADTSEYPLPDGVSADQVIRAVEGSLPGGEIQDFDISWQWEFFSSDQQDRIDTALGSAATADTITVGLFVVVEDDNDGIPDADDPDHPDYDGTSDEQDPEQDPDHDDGYITPDVPHTGDNGHIGMYLGLMVISFILLILLLLDRRREKKCE